MIYNYKKYLWRAALFLFFLPLAGQAKAEPSLQIKYEEMAFTAPVILQSASSTTPADLSWDWHTITPAFDYSFQTEGFYDPSRPLLIRIDYGETNNYLKQIFSYDSSSQTWRPLLTKDHPSEHYVTAATDATRGRLAVFASHDVLTVGTASWYKFKNGLFAASPDFAKGTVLRVHNKDNGKTVDVTINDFGPERALHPDRVVDLDYVAFGKIASPSAGLASVFIETMKTVPVGSKTNVTPAPSGNTQSVPNITASSAVIMLEKTGEVIWGKDEKKVAPLASLTKLVALRVFLDTKPNLKKVVTYKVADENYNNKYCAPGESARLKVKNGETMTVENLIYAALVGSANNAVESLVRVSGLKRDKFIAAMNAAVKKWGAKNTHFIEPTGLSAANVSSPYDYAIISKEVFKSALLKNVSTAKSYTFKTVNTKKSHTIKNTNQLVRSNSYPFVGSKTGYLEEAGYCLMTRVTTPQGNIIAVNFGSKSQAANFSDNEQLIRYGRVQLKK
jgi:D-alanyl-D-alanine endopeptidase (penicillin-binding protein 7)